jgi:hypothetical protein
VAVFVLYLLLSVRLQMDGLKTEFDRAAVEKIRYDGELRRLERVGAATKIACRQDEPDRRKVDITSLGVKYVIQLVRITD